MPLFFKFDHSSPEMTGETFFFTHTATSHLGEQFKMMSIYFGEDPKTHTEIIKLLSPAFDPLSDLFKPFFTGYPSRSRGLSLMLILSKTAKITEPWVLFSALIFLSNELVFQVRITGFQSEEWDFSRPTWDTGGRIIAAMISYWLDFNPVGPMFDFTVIKMYSESVRSVDIQTMKE